MDAGALAVWLITAAAVVVALGAIVAYLRLARAADEVQARIGSQLSRDWRLRPSSLLGAVDRLEAALAESEERGARFAEALQGASLGVLVTDRSGVVAFANVAAARYLGARHGEAVAEVRLREAIDRAVAGGVASSVEVSLYTPVRRSLLVNAVPLLTDGERSGAAAYVEDVTESRRVDEMRRDFIANVSHELKTPLGALALLAETLAARVDDPEAAARLAAHVGEESARLSLLIEDILDLSRAETSPSRFEPVRLGSLVADVVVAAEERAAEHEVRLETERLDGDVVVMGDRRQLRSMLTNLLDNAIKYSRPAGDTDGSWPSVRLRVVAEGRWAVIEVDDEGIGIAESHQTRIFERFYRVDRARSRATGGTGLGLSIVRNVVVNHGGDVIVESKVGEGSLFRVTLPLRKEGE